MNALLRFDIRMIDRVDAAMTTAQRRGMPRNTVEFLLEGFFWVGSMVDGWSWSHGTVALIAIPLFIWSWLFWNASRGYQHDARKTMMLNIVVSARRSWHAQRMMTLGSLSLMVVAASSVSDYFLVSAAITYAFTLYVMTCRFLGPGEFGRERRESTRALPEMT